MAALTVLILGCGDVGSAAAHRLHRSGACVLLCDLPRPTHSRRGMAYTDALFDGAAMLEEVEARHVVSIEAISSLWARGDAIPVVALDEGQLVRELRFDAAVDAVMRRHRAIDDRRWLARRVVGLGPGFTPGVNCHVAVETQWGETMGQALADRSPAPLAGGPVLLAGAGRERFASAPVSGRWRTQARIGLRVAAGDLLGDIDGTLLRAPLGGSLRGLTRDDVQVEQGQKLVEVDPRDPPRVFGLGERPAAIARGVCDALGLSRPSQATCI